MPTCNMYVYFTVFAMPTSMLLHTLFVLAYSNLPTERSATPWFNHTIIPKTDSYGKTYCCADACRTQNTTAVSLQGTGCNCNQWS